MEPDFLTRLPVQIPPELKTGISTRAASVRRFGGWDLAASASRQQDNLPLLLESVSK
jgi:hypothetical protein